jgi:hypothetical protein
VHAAHVHDRAGEAERIARLDRSTLEAELLALKTELADARSAHEQLRRAYGHALEQLQLLRRRLFVAKAERVEAVAEQLVF